ncbi:MAG: alpha/beta hydrolase [Halioglobus sp.]
MRPTQPILLTALFFAGVGAYSTSVASTDSRWSVIANAYELAATLTGTEDNKTHGEGDVNIVRFDTEFRNLEGRCNQLAKRDRAPCLDDLLRLKSLVKSEVNPNDPNRNRRFATNIPNFVSPEMSKVMANWTPFWLADGFTGFPDPSDKAAWQFEVLHGEVIGPAAKAGEAFLGTMNITTEERELNGVRTVMLHPSENRHPGKVLIHVHGGAFYANTPETTYDRTAPLADLMGINIVSVDYKLMPGKPGEEWDILDQRDQVIAVFDALTAEGTQYKPEDIGIYGCSAGSGLVAMSVNKMSHRGGKLPAAAVLQGAMVDFTMDSDSNTTLRYDDPRTNFDLLMESVWPMLGMTEEKAKDPRYSTVLDNFEGRDFPPTMIQQGTKEIQMSDGVRMYDVLRRAGHTTQLDVHDAMQHCFHGHWGTPEAEVAVTRVAEWFAEHLYTK